MIESSVVAKSSIGNFVVTDTLSTKVTESPFTPSAKLMNTLIEIVSSIVVVSAVFMNILDEIESSIPIESGGSVSLNKTDFAVILSSIITESSTKYNGFTTSKSSTDTVSNTE